MRRLIIRCVLIVAVLMGVLTLGANSPLISHRTADGWPNPMGSETIVTDYAPDTGIS